MTIATTFGGIVYLIPEVGNENWGQTVTDFLVAIPEVVLQTTGGAFFLQAEVDFGPTAGLKTLSLKSRTSSVASSGLVRMANTDFMAWRNAANTGDLTLGVNTLNQLLFNGGLIEGSFKAITGSNGITVTSGTSTIALSSFYSEFTSVSGSLQAQIDAVTNTSYTHTQSLASATWTITHNLNSLFWTFTLYDSQNIVIEESDSYALNANTFIIVFASAVAGTALLVKSGGTAGGGGSGANSVETLNLLEGNLSLTGSNGNTITDNGSNTINVAGFRTEFVAASGSLQSQVGGKALIGSDGVTVTSGSSTITLAGFRTEFVNASGTLQTDINTRLSAVVQDTAPQLGGNLDVNNKTIFSTTGQNVRLVTDSGDLVKATIGATDRLVVSGTGVGVAGNFVAGRGDFDTGLTVSGVPVQIKRDILRVNLITNSTWTNAPSARELYGTTGGAGNRESIRLADLTDYNQVRFVVNQLGGSTLSTASIALKYAPVTGVTITGASSNDYLDVTTTGSLSYSAGTLNLQLFSDYQTLVPAARGQVFLAVVGSGWSGSQDPQYGAIDAWFK